MEGDELAGLIVDPRGGERTFGPYATTWIDTRLARGRPLTPATRQGYKGLLRRHLNPAFEKAALRKITPERVRVWHSDLIKSAGQDQAAKSYRLLRAILNTAVSDRLLTQNPCTVPGAGTENTPERPLLDTATVLDLADAIEPRLRALVLLAGFGALRPGELLGLERRDFDTLRGTVQVRRQAQEITGMGRTMTDPKTDAGTRTLSLPGIVRGDAHTSAPTSLRQPTRQCSRQVRAAATAQRPERVMGPRALLSGSLALTSTTSATTPPRSPLRRASQLVNSWSGSVTPVHVPPSSTSTPPRSADGRLLTSSTY